jgi:multimeric flavodoxin WrbA
MSCKTKLEKCAIKDDLTMVLDAIREADVLLLTSPVYFGMISGQLKCLIDRMYSFYKPDYISNPAPSRLPIGKKGVFIITQGSSKENMFDDIHPRIEGILQRQGFKECRTIRCCGLPAQEDSIIPEEIMKLTEETAEEMVGL